MRPWAFHPPPHWGAVKKTVNIILLASLTFGGVTVPEAWAATLTVSTGGTNSGNCQGSACRTITYALGQAVGGDTVNVGAGIYNAAGGETFPLGLVDGVALIGDTTNPASRTISAPQDTQVFFANAATSLGATTRVAGFTLTRDVAPGGGGSSAVMEFDVGVSAKAPRIDHNAFVGFWTPVGQSEGAIWVEDDSSGDGSFTATIENNTFTGFSEAVGIYLSSSGGLGDSYSPVIANNTFTDNDWPLSYSLSSSAEGTVGGSVTGNTFTGTHGSDIYIGFSPDYTDGLAFNPTISGNTFTGMAAAIVNSPARGHNIYIGASFSYFSGDVSFTPTISNNTMTTASGSNVDVYNFSFSSGTGNVTFAPTITGNTMSASEMNVWIGAIDSSSFSYRGASWHNVSGDVSFSPTISGNSMGNGTEQDAILVSVERMSVDAGFQSTLSPKITGNQIADATDHGIYVFVDGDLYEGALQSDLTISGNTISGAKRPIELEVYSAFSFSPAVTVSSKVKAMAVELPSEANWTINNNTITGAGLGSDGILVDIGSVSYSSSGTFDLTIAGNTITDAGAGEEGAIGNVGALSIFSADGIDVTVGSHKYLLDSPARAARGMKVSALKAPLGSRDLLIQGNTVTGATGTGIWLGLDYSSSFAFDEARVVDNVIEDGDGNGLSVTTHDYDLETNPITVSCNTITGNHGNGIEQASGSDVPADFGHPGAAGNNTLVGNGGGESSYVDLYNNNAIQAWAQGNYWGNVDSWGNSDPGPRVHGPVDTANALTAIPTVTITADLDDVHSIDVPPLGPSVGDTFCYDATVQIGAASSCGDTSVAFTAPIPANATYVDGSLSTEPVGLPGSVSGDPPVLDVTIGALGAGQTAHVHWCVTADSGTGFSTQGGVSALKSGTVVTNDPATTPPGDPTNTAFGLDQTGNVPALGEWGLIILAGLLLLFGAVLLRRRHVVAAGLVLLLATSAAWAGAVAPRSLRQVTKGQWTDIASTVKSASVHGNMVTLTLADGTSITVPRHDVRVRSHRQTSERTRLQGLRPEDRLIERSTLKAARLVERATVKAERQAMTPEQRVARRHERRLEHKAPGAREARTGRERIAPLAKGTPVVVSIQRDGHGRIVKARVETCTSEQEARTALQNRRNAGAKQETR